MFREILVPLDGSPLAEHALPFAVSIAMKTGATVHVVLVHVPDAYGEYAAPHSDDFDMEAKAREKAYLDALGGRLAKAFKGTIQIHHLEGIVQETLVEEVAERGVDLVVMSAHGWGYSSRALLGSVSDYLMRHLGVPMLLMHSEVGMTELNRPLSFRRILIPLDGSELAEAMLEPALALGALWNAEYRYVRVMGPPSHHLTGSLGDEPHAPHQGIVDATTRHWAAYLEKMAHRLRKQSLTVETHVRVSRKVAAAILEEATTTGCDLIAISTHGRGGLSRLLRGSVADKVVRGANTPVLVYRTDG